MIATLYVALGGAVGAAGRHLVNLAMLRLMGPAFPWGTLTVNIVGSLLMGVLIELLALRYSASQETRLFLATGVLGGFTTFSAFSLDVAVLMERKQTMLAALYIAGSVGASIGALFFGLWLVRSALA